MDEGLQEYAGVLFQLELYPLTGSRLTAELIEETKVALISTDGQQKSR
jgi:hypothetical protein